MGDIITSYENNGVFDDQKREHLSGIIKDYEKVPGSLLTVLSHAQRMFGYLPKEVLYDISTGLKTPLSIVMGVVTFYSYFSTTPKGKYTIRVCNGTACHVKGSRDILQTIQNRLKIKGGEATEDFKFSLETVSCLGACALAPVMMINDVYHGKLSSQKVNEILCQLVEN
ncbi:MAG: NAD(P)H-dependent oxidoreductase subunit E [bacterium]